MNTNKVIGIVLLALGAFLLYSGYQSSQGLDDQVSEAFTGNFTDETLWYLVGGGIAVIVGIVMLVRR